MSEQVDHSVVEEPCRCHDSHASVVPFHSGHCCFFPPDQTCHQQEVAVWVAKRDRIVKLDPQGGDR